MTDDRDAMIESIAGALRPLPLVDDAAKARVLIAVAAERERDRQATRVRTARRRVSIWVTSVGSAAAAAVLLTVSLTRTPAHDAAPPAAITVGPVATSPAAPPQAQLAAGTADADVAPQPVQLVFNDPTAASVRVVGDFNAWDKDRAPMTRDPETGLWTVTLTLRPGRHVYAFVVNDSLWKRDPRAAAAPDADFGRPGSILLVGRP